MALKSDHCVEILYVFSVGSLFLLYTLNPRVRQWEATLTLFSAVKINAFGYY